MAVINASKYAPLTRYLRAQGDLVSMTFADIERVIGARLPPSAPRNRAYWSNNSANSVLTRAWLAAGFRSEQVDLDGREVVFRRVASAKVAASAGFNEAPAAPFPLEEPPMPAPSLFGCMAGTMVVNCDLAEPADPTLADYLDHVYGPVA